MKTGEKIAKLRKENNITQEQLADLLNVSRQSISKYESNLSLPEVDKLITISEIFNCSLDYLLKDEIENDNKDNIKKETKPKNKFFFCLTNIKLLSYSKFLLSFIIFFLLFAPFISLGNLIYEGISLTITYNGFEAISMVNTKSLFTMISVIILLLSLIILSLIESFYISKSKTFNIINLIVSFLSFIVVLCSPNFIVLEEPKLVQVTSFSSIVLKVGAIFILIFLFIYIILSIINLILLKKNKITILYTNNKEVK